MKTHNIIPGTPEWHDHRAKHKNASDAPAMLGCSPYKTREQLIREMVTGVVPEVDGATQVRFDNGHRYEALARPIGEEIMGDDLAPVVGSEGDKSASFDGLNIMGKRPWEHKSPNDEIRAALPHHGRDSHLHNDGKLLGKVYRVQMEQQLMVCDDTKCLFSATKWDGDRLVEERHAWYHTDPELRAEIVAGWKLLDEDAAKWTPTEVVVPAVATPQMALPSVIIKVEGNIALVDNLEKFGTALTAYVTRINKKPESDQDFADLEATVRTLKAAEDELDKAERNALSQTASIDTMRRTVDLYRETARTNRLLVEKLVKAEKENRRIKIVSDAVAELHTYMKDLNKRARDFMPQMPNQFQEVIKGLKSLDSMKAKVDTELARCKIEANNIANKISFNLELLDENTEYGFLFADVRQIVLKQADDFKALVTSRIAEHKAAKAKEAADAMASIEAAAQEKARKEAAVANEAALGEIQGIQQQVYIATTGRAGVRRGGTIECIRETLAETETWVIDDRFGALKGAAQVAKDNAITSIRALLDQAEARAVQAAATPAPTPVPVSAPAPVANLTHEAVVATMPASVRQAIAAAGNPEPTLKLGDISARIAPLSITAEGLRAMGFEPAKSVGTSKLYHEASFPKMVAAMQQHLGKLTNTTREAVAA